MNIIRIENPEYVNYAFLILTNNSKLSDIAEARFYFVGKNGVIRCSLYTTNMYQKNKRNLPTSFLLTSSRIFETFEVVHGTNTTTNETNRFNKSIQSFTLKFHSHESSFHTSSIFF